MGVISKEDFDFLSEIAPTLDGPALEAALGKMEQYKFYESNVDTSPKRNAELIAAQKAAAAQQARYEGPDMTYAAMTAAKNVFPIPKTIYDLPEPEPGSRSYVLRQQEQQGLDTLSGATDFWQTANLARKVNDSRAQMIMLEGEVRDRIAEAGIELPQSVRPLYMNEELGQLEALVPNEDGKLVRTLVDPELFTTASLGNVADLENIGEMAGAVFANLAPVKHPAIAELVGATGGRYLGTAIEFLLDSKMLGGDMGMEDLEEAFGARQAGEATLNTLLSRGAGRAVERLRYGPRKGGVDFDPKLQSADEINANIQQSADTLEELQKLTDKPVMMEAGSASGSVAEIQVAGMREGSLRPKDKAALDRQRLANREAYGDAVATIHSRVNITDPVNSERVVRELGERAAERQAILDNPIVKWINTGRSDGIEYAEVRFAGGDLAPQPGSGYLNDRMPGGAIFEINHHTRQVTLESLADAPGFEGGSAILFKAFAEEVLPEIPPGYQIASGYSVSESAERMMRNMADRGIIKLRSNRPDNLRTITDDNGVKHTLTLDQSPVFFIDEIPGVWMSVPGREALGSYNRNALSRNIQDLERGLMESELQVAKTHNRMMADIGWNSDRGRSIYRLNNPRSSALNRTINQIEARRQQALTGVDQSADAKKLSQLLLRETDEEGNVFYAGLTGEELDLGQFLRARASVKRLAEDSGDPEFQQLAKIMDDMVYTNKMYSSGAQGGVVDTMTANKVRQSIGAAEAAQQQWARDSAFLTSNKLFAKDADGNYLNTDIDNLGKLMRNGSGFREHAGPWLDSNVPAQEEFAAALMQVYEKQVIGKGWTRERHSQFLSDYSDSLEAVFGREITRDLGRVRFTNDGRNPLKEYAERSMAVLNRLNSIVEVNPRNILGSLRKAEARDRAKYIRTMKKEAPDLYAQLQASSLREIGEDLNAAFFSPTRNAQGINTVTNRFDTWFTGNKDTLMALHGPQYVNDLQTVLRAMQLDARRTLIKPMKREAQPDTVRVTRTLLGPLSKFQRRISAGNFINVRLSAKKVLDVYNDPNKLRQLMSARVPVTSRPGIAVLSRLGIIDNLGPESYDPNTMTDEQYQRGLEWLSWVEDMDQERYEEQQAAQEMARRNRPKEPELVGNTAFGKKVTEAYDKKVEPWIDGMPMWDYVEQYRKTAGLE